MTLYTVIARTLKKYAHRGKITGTSSDSLQLCPFLKWKLILKGRICSQRLLSYGAILSFNSSSNWYGNSLLPHWMTSLECYYFYYARASLRNGSYAYVIGTEAELSPITRYIDQLGRLGLVLMTIHVFTKVKLQ